jgi:hypothetical protein
MPRHLISDAHELSLIKIFYFIIFILYTVPTAFEKKNVEKKPRLLEKNPEKLDQIWDLW